MDYQDYSDQYFVDPPPAPRFAYTGLLGATLYFQDYEAAVNYYQQVLGPPAYVEGDSTKGWRLGETWLTLLRGQDGNPHNAELMLLLPTPAEAERLQAAFVAAGGQGADPVDTLMYEPVRACYVCDPFGTNLMIYSRLPAEGG
jgi:hypothetical protein